MVLTKDFRETVQRRAQEDMGFRVELLTEAVASIVAGDLQVGKSLLRDCVNATVGFDALSVAIGKSPKSVMRMLSEKGNPTSDNLLHILAYLQQEEGISFSIQARR